MVIFVVAILVSIGLHELGHMIPAKKFGGKVTQYFIGFGPTVWSKQVGETEYGVKAIPLGGYVKIVGMLPPAAEELADDVDDRRGGQPGAPGPQVQHRAVHPADLRRPRGRVGAGQARTTTDRLFYKMPWWKKVIVMAGGPTVNILIAFFIFWGVFATYGQNDRWSPSRPARRATVSECVIPYRRSGRACTADDPRQPGRRRPACCRATGSSRFNGDGDRPAGTQLRELIRDNDDGEAVIGYERDGEDARPAPPTPRSRPRPASDDGRDAATRSASSASRPSPRVTETGGPLYTLEQMGTMTVETVKALGTLPVKVWDVAQAIVGARGARPRTARSASSAAAGSPARPCATTSFPVQEKAVFLLMLIAGFNFFIGMFNFIPLLPLDGGHIASALWEALRRGVARLRGRPDPGYVDVAKLLPVAYVVAVGAAGHGRGADRRRPRRTRLHDLDRRASIRRAGRAASRQ